MKLVAAPKFVPIVVPVAAPAAIPLAEVAAIITKAALAVTKPVSAAIAESVTAAITKPIASADNPAAAEIAPAFHPVSPNIAPAFYLVAAEIAPTFNPGGPEITAPFDLVCPRLAAAINPDSCAIAATLLKLVGTKVTAPFHAVGAHFAATIYLSCAHFAAAVDLGSAAFATAVNLSGAAFTTAVDLLSSVGPLSAGNHVRSKPALSRSGADGDVNLSRRGVSGRRRRAFGPALCGCFADFGRFANLGRGPSELRFTASAAAFGAELLARFCPAIRLILSGKRSSGKTKGKCQRQSCQRSASGIQGHHCEYLQCCRPTTSG